MFSKERLPYSPFFDGFGPLDVERGAHALFIRLELGDPSSGPSIPTGRCSLTCSTSGL